MPSPSKILLDTHVLVRMISEPKLLSRQQARVIEEAERRERSVGIAAMSLLEVASLLGQGRLDQRIETAELFHILENDSRFEILPATFAIAIEVAALANSVLRDPADLAIVATARVHGLKLLTSDQRIVRSGLARTID